MRSDELTGPATADASERVGDEGRPHVRHVDELGELELLLDLSVRLAGSLELAAVLDHTLAAAAAIGHTTMGAITLRADDGAFEPGASLGVTDELLARLGGAAQLCLQRRAAVVVADTDLDPLAHEAHEAAQDRFRALHAVPLLARGGRLLGVLTLYFHQPRRLSERVARLLGRCVDQSAPAIERALQHRRTLQELADTRVAEAAVRDESERLSLALQAAGVSSWEWNIETGAVTWSETIRELLGLGPDEPAPDETGWFDRIHPDDLVTALHTTREAVRTHSPTHSEFRVRHADGTYRWIAARGDVLRAGEAPLRYVGANYDITTRRCAEIALRESEERQRTLADNLPSGFIYQVIEGVDGSRRFAYVSRGVEAICGMTPAEIVANPAGLYGVIVDEDREQMLAIEGTAFRARTHFDWQFRIHGRDQIRYIRCHSAPRPLRGGGTAWDGIAIDVTEHARALDALKDSEERYRTLFSSLDEGFCIVDVVFDGDRGVDYRFLEVNPAFEKHTGLHDAVGKTILELAPGHDRHWAEAYGEVARTGQPARFVNLASALGPRWYDVYAFKLGEHVAILFTDITARIQAERERERLVEQLRDADRKKDDFIALLAHELRNPLAPIRTGLQVMHLAGDNLDVAARARAMMDRQLSHMVRLIDDLMDVSRISRNKLDLRRERILLADVVGSAVETARPQIEAAGHELQVSLPAGPVFLDADLTRLAQVFSNLLTNSAKYTGPGGHIQLTAERSGDEVVVTVRDDGIGIPAGSLSSIFDMFSQVDRSVERSAGGLGVGLALVKGLVEMHGGSVTAASAGEGRGSTFTVRLPALVDRARTDSSDDPHDLPPGPGRRVLVVDDNRDGADAMAMMLEMLGHEVHTAHDGYEAIEAADKFRPQVILMDVGMPRLNGLDATRRIRETPWGRAMTIIALTGWGQDADRERSRAAGCDNHLVKPVNLQDLEQVLDAPLGHSH
ncbi:ATP-binding protein [Nannocystis bainbridge]|uniref:histidine kinase n=1 Tax=Nannocystis bainbridge TaxID=2995303 RepID=A0ABT5DUY3_9BACT|nr:ATP-binding protein [Nannocystis bainbridge]MDC0716237.1 ATP-binding protein [Nannocystis bainbridge]